MRRLRNRLRHERGASAVLVGLMMVPLLGFAAIAIDVGALYVERAQLQNGADAGALAAAANCAKSGCGNAMGVVGPYVNGNANDNASTPTAVTYPAPGKVQVSVETLEAGGNAVRHWFAPMLGFDETTVAAEATAEWGQPVAGKALNLAIGQCEFDRAVPQEGAANPVKMVIAWHENTHKDCPGLNPAGGFGWLDGTNCETVYDLSATGEMTVSAAPGISPKCDLSTFRNKTILIPIFSQIAGTGTNTKFTITGFAAFTVTGYKTSPGNPASSPTVDKTAPYCLDNKGKVDNSCVFLQGYFERYVAIGEYWEMGETTGDYALSVVRLIE